MLHTYPEDGAVTLVVYVVCMYVPTYIPGTRCCIQISIHWNTSISLASPRLAQSSRPHRLRVDLSCHHPSSSLLPEVSSILFFVACIALPLPENVCVLVRREKVLLLLLLLLLPCSLSFRDFLLLQRGSRRVCGHHHVREGVWSAQGWAVCSIQPR